jgi:GrpB-like predicted nucleotidyltransferase (UPF0157 family)
MSLGLKRNIVELVDHDPDWENIAFQTIQKLWQVFGSAAKDIQHIGSTSIRHIKAKPQIDIAVAIGDFRDVEAWGTEKVILTHSGKPAKCPWALPQDKTKTL